MPPRVAKGATQLLTKLGIDVRTQARVVEVRPDGAAWPMVISSLPSSWSGGPDFLTDLDGLEASRNNQLVVTLILQTTRDPDIFAIGAVHFC